MSRESKPCQSYIARGVRSKFRNDWHAEFGFPGGFVAAVLDGTEPAVYGSEIEAEVMALRALRDSLNARQRFASRNEISRKLTGDEFAHELGLADIRPSEWATMWGAKQDRVMQQIEGSQEVPFPARWILPVLRTIPGAMDLAQKIVAENTTMKPEWLERRRQRVESEG